MSGLIESIEKRQIRKVPRFSPGDKVKVHFRIVEGQRSRTQVFEGIVIRRQGAGARETFTVRKVTFGVGVERTFPVHSPKVERIEVVSRGDVSRSKLYYLRDRVGRRARVREKLYAEVAAEEAELVAEMAVEEEAAEEATEAEEIEETEATVATEEAVQTEGAEEKEEAVQIEEAEEAEETEEAEEPVEADAGDAGPEQKEPEH